MSTSSNTHRPRREKANLHPGRIILETQTKQCTPAQKKADDLCAQEAIDAQAAAIQQAHAWVSEMETTMEVRQVTQEAAKAKPVRPRQAPASRGRPTNIPTQPHVEGENSWTICCLTADTDNMTVDGTGPPVAMEARQAIQDTAKAKSVRPRQVPISRGRPTNIPIQPRVEGEDSSIMSFDRHW